ncbi:MAG TPA: DUF4337 domain-containing protein [Hyphomicrobiaceae bacterium]|jgi:hypothetical protein|nr:DUF4337 domain-containing protein [Hyphomicrobiaceae bacterium]
MAVEQVGPTVEVEARHARDRWIGVYIGALAVVLAICSMGGSNAAKDATLKNIEATNNWSFFQAKNLRRHILRMQTEELELLLLSTPALTDTARQAIEARIRQYKEQEKTLTSDAASGEGLDELFAKGKALEVQRDTAMARDPYFDYAQALLQIAIVLASVSIISGGSFLLIGSGLIGLLGTLLTIDGFTMMVRLPFI